MQFECVCVYRILTRSATVSLSLVFLALMFPVLQNGKYSMPGQLIPRHHDGVTRSLTQHWILLMQVWDLLTWLFALSRWTFMLWLNGHLIPPTAPAAIVLLLLSQFSLFFYAYHPLSFSQSELWCLVWCNMNSHDDVISVSQQVGAASSSWVGVLPSCQAGRQRHVTAAKAITSASLWAPSLCQHILIFTDKTDGADIIFKSFY